MIIILLIFATFGVVFFIYKRKHPRSNDLSIDTWRKATPSRANLESEIARANEKMMLGEHKSGVAILDKILIIDPKNHSALIIRAICLSSLNFNLDAIDDYELAIKINKSNGNNFGLLGLVYNKIGNLEMAKKNLEIAVDKGFLNYEMMYNMILDLSVDMEKRIIARNQIPENLNRREPNCFEDDLSEVDRDLLDQTVRNNLPLLAKQVKQNPNNKELVEHYEYAKSKYLDSQKT
jgi:tetratricopeptide (TPR) repeat protein